MRSAVATFATLALLASAATSNAAVSAELDTNGAQPTNPSEIILAAADCYSVGQQVASQHGGELYNASASSQGGQNVCVVVVVVPGKNGKPPRRVEVVVPAG